MSKYKKSGTPKHSGHIIKASQQALAALLEKFLYFVERRIDADAPGRETATAEAAEAIFIARSAPNRSSMAKKKPRKVSPAAVVSTTGTLNISQ